MATCVQREAFYFGEIKRFNPVPGGQNLVDESTSLGVLTPAMPWGWLLSPSLAKHGIFLLMPPISLLFVVFSSSTHLFDA
jgi:hypothetical protein